MKRFIFLAVLLIVSSSAFAQMGGGYPGQHHRPGATPGTPAPGAMNPGYMGGGAMRSTIVADDGTVFLLRRKDADNDGIFEAELVAVRPSGTVAWSAVLDTGMNRIELAGDLLLTATAAHDFQRWNPPTETQLVAYSINSGARQWALELNGVVADLEATSNGVYAIVITPRTTARSLLLINTTGAIVWSLPLD